MLYIPLIAGYMLCNAVTVSALYMLAHNTACLRTTSK